RLLEVAEPEFAPSTWQAFQRLAVDGRPAAEVAAELGTTVNAVLLAKSRVLRRLRQEARGLVDWPRSEKETVPVFFKARDPFPRHRWFVTGLGSPGTTLIGESSWVKEV